MVAKPIVLFIKYDLPEDAVTAVACGRGTLHRQPGQTLSALLSLARQELQCPVLWAALPTIRPQSGPPVP